MGAIKKIIFLIFFFNFISCNIFEKGKVDSNGQYVPKHDRYALKNRTDCVFLNNLDTVNIYRLAEMYFNGKMTFPVNDYPENKSYDQIHVIKSYIKFYPERRCLMFSIPTKNDNGTERILQETDLNPNNENYSKSYYCGKDKNNIQIESFVYGEGFGDYVLVNCYLNESGDTLKMITEKAVDIYVKEKIPFIKTYNKIDW